MVDCWLQLCAAVVTAAVLIIPLLAYNPLAWWRLRALPSPPHRLPFLGHLLSIQKKTLHAFSYEGFRQCGPIFTLWWGVHPHVVVCDRASCHKVLQRCHMRPMPPAPVRGQAASFYSSGLVFAKDMPFHRTLRAMWAPHFSPGSLAAVVPVMTLAVNRLMDRLAPAAQAGVALDLHQYVSCMSMEAVGRAAFGIDLDGYPAAPTAAKGSSAAKSTGAEDAAAAARKAHATEVVEATNLLFLSQRPDKASAWVALYMILPAVLGPAIACLAKAFPDASWRRVLAAHGTIRRVCGQLIQDNDSSKARQASETAAGGTAATAKAALVGQASVTTWAKGLDAGSFITHMQQTRNKDTGAPPSLEVMVTNTRSFLAAGYDTTANTLAMALHHIAQHPEVEAKLLQEVDAFGAAGSVPGLDDFAKFPYLAAVIDETLRLTPTVAWIPRMNTEPINLNGFDFAANTIFQVSVWSAHRDPDVWREAEKFVPERFLPGYPEWAAPEGAFIPFGGGARMCVGYKFALQEQKLALVALFQRFTFRTAPGYPPMRLGTGITTGPDAPLMMTVHSRNHTK